MYETNIPLLNKKLSIFNSSFNSKEKNINKIIYVTDFDYTVTSKYDYETNEKLLSTYGIYNQEAFGGDHSLYLNEDKKLAELYSKYEDDTSYDYETRRAKSFDWYIFSLLNMSHPKLTIDSFKKMVEMSIAKIKFRKKFKEFCELLIKNNIPIVIISGGIKEIILEILKTLKIEGIDEYFNKKRIIIIANPLFDEEEKLINWKEKNNEIVYPFNKSKIAKKIIEENFKGFENIFIVGDYVTDYYSISELGLNKKENIIGIGFLSYDPQKLNSEFNIKNNKTIKEYQEVYDVVLLNDEGYDYIIKILNYILK